MGLFCKGFFMNMYHLFAARIGHLAMNTELFLRRQSRGMVEGELFRITDHFSGEKLANEQLYKMIQRRAVVHEVTLQEYQALADLPPSNRTNVKFVKSVTMENDGHEKEQIYRRTDHWVLAASRSRHADQGVVPQRRF
jgi:hypothetical protein